MAYDFAVRPATATASCRRVGSRGTSRSTVRPERHPTPRGWAGASNPTQPVTPAPSPPAVLPGDEVVGTAVPLPHDLLAYAGQVAARPDSAYLPFDLIVREDASPRDLLRTVAGCWRLLSNALAASEPTARTWHWGPTDLSGFTALGVNEMLVHTYDVIEGLGSSACRESPATSSSIHLAPRGPGSAPLRPLRTLYGGLVGLRVDARAQLRSRQSASHRRAWRGGVISEVRS